MKSKAFLVDLVANRKAAIREGRCQVGTDASNDIVFTDKSMSPFHFVITSKNGKFSIQNGGKLCQTFLNGDAVVTTVNINDGDVLKAGDSLFWFVEEH